MKTVAAVHVTTWLRAPGRDDAAASGRRRQMTRARDDRTTFARTNEKRAHVTAVKLDKNKTKSRPAVRENA